MAPPSPREPGTDIGDTGNNRHNRKYFNMNGQYHKVIDNIGSDSECSNSDIPNDDTLAYSLYTAGYRPPRPSRGIMNKPLSDYHIDPCCAVCSEAVYLNKSGIMDTSFQPRPPTPHRILVDSCCTLSFIPHRIIPDNQLYRIYTPVCATKYTTSSGVVECSEAIQDLRIVVNTECGNKLVLYVSGTVAPPNSNAPFLLSGSVVDSLYMGKDTNGAPSVKVVIHGYSVVSYLVKGMPAIDFSFDTGDTCGNSRGIIDDHYVLYNSVSDIERDNKIREYHKRLGHIGPDALRLTLVKNGIVFPVKAIRDVVGPCHICQRFKGNPTPTKYLITERSDTKAIDYSKLVFNRHISIDLKPIGKQGFYLFVIMCEDTRFIAIKWIKDKSASGVLNVYRKVWGDVHGNPNGSVLSDGGSEWSKLIPYLVGQHNGCKWRKTPKDTGFSNPRNERSHGPIMTMLKSALRDLDIPPIPKVVKPISEVYIPSVLNNTVKRVLGGYSPIELALGVAPSIPEYYPGEKVRFVGKPNTAIRPTFSDRWTVGKYVSHTEFKHEIIVIYNSDKASDKMEAIHASRVKKWRSSVEDTKVTEFKVTVPEHKVIQGIEDPGQCVEDGVVPMGVCGTGTGVNLCSGTGRDASIMREYFSQVISVDCESEAAELAIAAGDHMACKPDIECSILTWDYQEWYTRWLSKGNSVVTCIIATPPCNIFTLIRTMPDRRPPSKAEWLLACDIILKIRQVHKYFSEYLADRCNLGVSLFIENPASGRIRECGHLTDMREVITSWCKVGSTMRKDTVFFTNVCGKYFNLPLPCSKVVCELVRNGGEHYSCLKASTLETYSLPSIFIHNMCNAVVGIITDTDICAPVMPSIEGPSGEPEQGSAKSSAPVLDSAQSGLEDSQEESEPDLYEVDDIIGKKGKGPKIRYKVKWASGETSWLPIQRLRKFPETMKLVRQYDSAIQSMNMCELISDDIDDKVCMPCMCYTSVSNEVPYDVMCYNCECVYGTVVQESDLDKSFTDKQVNDARLAELSGWYDLGVPEYITESQGLKAQGEGKAILIAYRWVYSYTLDTDNNKVLKARLVLKGYQDKRGLQGASPTVNKSILRLYFYCAQGLDGNFTVVDIKKAFLQAPASTDISILIRPPDKYVQGDTYSPPGFYKLNKAVYGSVDAARRFYLTLVDKFKDNNWRRSAIDPCLFTKSDDGTVTSLAVTHVDDVCAKGPNIDDSMTKLGLVIGKSCKLDNTKFLGVIYRHIAVGVVLSMTQYIEENLTKPVTRRIPNTPMPLEAHIDLDSEEDIALSTSQVTVFQSKLGKLQWLAVCLRFDILYAVHYLKRYQCKPTVQAMALLDRLIAYVWNTKELELVIPPPSSSHRLVGYSDSTWAHIRDSYRSQSGYIIGMESLSADGSIQFSPITWVSHTQSRVTKSSTTAEVLSLVDSVESTIFIKSALGDMGMCNIPTIAKVDSANAVKLLDEGNYVNPKDKSCIVSISVLREYVSEGKVNIEKVDRVYNYADELVKPTYVKLLRGLFHNNSYSV